MIEVIIFGSKVKVTTRPNKILKINLWIRYLKNLSCEGKHIYNISAVVDTEELIRFEVKCQGHSKTTHGQISI